MDEAAETDAPSVEEDPTDFADTAVTDTHMMTHMMAGKIIGVSELLIWLIITVSIRN